MARVQILVGARHLLSKIVQTGTGVHPASSSYRGAFPRLNGQGSNVDRSPVAGSEVMNEQSCTFTPAYSFMERAGASNVRSVMLNIRVGSDLERPAMAKFW